MKNLFVLPIRGFSLRFNRFSPIAPSVSTSPLSLYLTLTHAGDPPSRFPHPDRPGGARVEGKPGWACAIYSPSRFIWPVFGPLVKISLAKRETIFGRTQKAFALLSEFSVCKLYHAAMRIPALLPVKVKRIKEKQLNSNTSQVKRNAKWEEWPNRKEQMSLFARAALLNYVYTSATLVIKCFVRWAEPTHTTFSLIIWPELKIKIK